MDIPIEVVIGSCGGLFMLLIMAHIFLLMTNISKLNQHKQLKKEWDVLLPKKQEVEKVVNNMRAIKSKSDAIINVTGGEVIAWSPKLNIISDEIPRGVWLTKVALTDEMLFLEGSAISNNQDELINVHKFISNLTKQPKFLDHLYQLELGSIQRRSESNMDVADFLITMKIKGKAKDEK